ncbi:uncharacterized protein LOC129589869 [Paramacrobiotus metropolitanus]|uniref:uncharacterized protein LOC129589869 n=1 Tax=Paramacrobiotus metropolitanus TaxID=2943436 RepID=UPI002445FF64|nr:uncharacterized protein LOC129589869 [Paramacrobiotus metropolitanus]
MRYCTLSKMRRWFIMFWFISNMDGGLADGDCSLKNSTVIHDAVSPAAEYPFRTDLLTVEECSLYLKYLLQRSICTDVMDFSNWCNVNAENPRKAGMLHTYWEVTCFYRSHALVANTTKHVRKISPQRAVLLHLFEWEAEQDPVTIDIVEPIRNQTIHLAVNNCRAPNATAKVHALGLLPNVYSFALGYCPNVTIQKKHFGGMPQLRMIAFYESTISALEPGTFTDLIHLRSLTLESYIIRTLLNQYIPEPAYRRFTTDDYLHYLYDVHCDCSYAWLRSFLKQRPYLIEKKNLGEVFIIGNYLSPAVERSGNKTDVFSIDCSKNVTLDNIWTGSEFSYKAACSNENC